VKVAIAAWHLKDGNVGLGRYCRGLIEAIGRVDQTNRYTVIMPGTYELPSRPNIRYRPIRLPLMKRRAWEQLTPALVGGYDLLHFPYDSAVIWKRSKFVVTVHDVKPMLFGSLKPRQSVSRWVEQRLIGDRWARIDHILTDSDCSRGDIARCCGIPLDRVTVVYPGVDNERFRPAPLENSHQPSQPGRPYILCVAGADPTKNVGTLVEAFIRLPPLLRNSHDLVLAGDLRRRADLRERVTGAGIEKQVRFDGIVSDDALIALYQHAALFVFPSRYEGFGLPVLEAMACGCPVICSNASSLPEVTGDAAILVDPCDVESLSRRIAEVLSDPALRQHLRSQSLQQAKTFSWDRTARETIAVYRKVVQG
jgi:glycosyltransferase involved in cell wall biosynthesis